MPSSIALPPDTLEPVIRRGLPAMLAVTRQVRRRIVRIARQMAGDGRSTTDIIRRCKLELARAEPVLARVITDSNIAAWLAAARPVARDAIPKPIAPPGESDTPDEVSATLVHEAMRAARSPAPSGEFSTMAGTPPLFPPPPPPISPPGFPEEEPEPGPIVRFPAQEAGIRDLARRQILLPGDYEALSDEAKGAAFTVARMMTRESVEKVRDALTEDIREGGTLREFRRNVAEVTNGVLTEPQVETIYRTQVGQAHASGLRQVLEHPLVSDEFPYVAYVATHDDRVRPTHIALEKLGINGTNVYYRDDPIIQRYWAPWEWNCRCVMIPYTVEDAAAAGVIEARQWLATGRPPRHRTFAKDPGFPLPKGWPRWNGGIQPVLAW